MPTDVRALLRLQFLELNGRPHRFHSDRRPALAMEATEPVDRRARNEEAIERATGDLVDGLPGLSVGQSNPKALRRKG